MSSPPWRLRQIVEGLVDAEVEFILVGGLAVNAWGVVRGTKDVDIVPEPSDQNIEQLAVVLEGLRGRLEVSGELLAEADVRTFLRAGDKALVVTTLGYVDVLQGIPQIPHYRELEKASQPADLDGIEVRVCSLDHLLGMKRAAGRPQDLVDVEALEAAHAEGDERSDDSP